MNKKMLSYFKYPICLLSTVFLFINKVSALEEVTSTETPGKVITFKNVDELLWSIIKTLQNYTLPVMTLALVLLGIKLVASGDDTSTKDLVKHWMVRILVGGLFIFSASAIANILKNALN